MNLPFDQQYVLLLASERSPLYEYVWELRDHGDRGSRGDAAKFDPRRAAEVAIRDVLARGWITLHRITLKPPRYSEDAPAEPVSLEEFEAESSRGTLWIDPGHKGERTEWFAALTPSGEQLVRSGAIAEAVERGFVGGPRRDPDRP